MDRAPSGRRMAFEAKQAYHIRAPPATVFAALTEPAGLVGWFLSAATIEARAGGAFAFDWLQGYHMDGRVLDCRPPRSVAFLWRDPGPDGAMIETRVDFVLSAQEGGTLLELKHSGFTDAAHFAECSSRWAYYLMNLKSYLEHRTDLRSRNDW